MCYLKEARVVQEGTLSDLPEVLVEFTASKVLGAQVVLFHQELAKGGRIKYYVIIVIS